MRRYTPLKPSRGTVIPADMRRRVRERDGDCVGSGRFSGTLFPLACWGANELDHVRASHATSMKSTTCDCNLVLLCASHHQYKTEHGKDVRPILLDYLAQFDYGEHVEGHV
jgi:hypothetical protein